MALVSGVVASVPPLLPQFSSQDLSTGALSSWRARLLHALCVPHGLPRLELIRCVHPPDRLETRRTRRDLRGQAAALRERVTRVVAHRPPTTRIKGLPG